MNLSASILKIAKAAKKVSYQMALISTKEKNQLPAFAYGLMRWKHEQSYLMKENAKDLAVASKS